MKMKLKVMIKTYALYVRKKGAMNNLKFELHLVHIIIRIPQIFLMVLDKEITK